jgi:hypothetical protein
MFYCSTAVKWRNGLQTRRPSYRISLFIAKCYLLLRVPLRIPLRTPLRPEGSWKAWATAVGYQSNFTCLSSLNLPHLRLLIPGSASVRRQRPDDLMEKPKSSGSPDYFHPCARDSYFTNFFYSSELRHVSKFLLSGRFLTN